MYLLQSKQIGAFFILMLLAGLAFTACTDNSVSSIPGEEDVIRVANSNLSSNSQTANIIVIDDFSSGTVNILACGNDVFDLFEDTTIIGGARELRARDSWSCQFGGRAFAEVDSDEGTLEWNITGRAAPEYSIQYGTEIGTQHKITASPNQGAGSEMNLELSLDDSILFELGPNSASVNIDLRLRDGNNNVYSKGISLSAGTNLIPLSDIQGLTETAASDIDGMSLLTWGVSGVIFDLIAIEKGATNTNVFLSDSNTDTYDPIFPAFADPQWQTSVCFQENSFGINADWKNPHKAFEVGPHPWESGTFDAEWINAANSLDSNQTADQNGNIGPDGFNWTRYDLPVVGNGDFVVQLLADNCSWIYLADEHSNSPQLVGYQGAVSTPGEYGVSLDGNHTLIFIIFDGGGLAGGKFRLETTESFGGTPPPPIVTNNPPVADAGPNQTVEATGPTTSVTLNGSGSSDPDGDALTYSWSVGGTEIATGVSPTVTLGLGTHAITLTVDDGNGDTDSDDVTVTVEDTAAPVLSYNRVTNNLWPPNHQMVLVATGISAQDLVDGATDVTVTVTSSEAVNGRGDGNTNSDWDVVVNPDGTKDVYVRSERSGGGNGRTYTISMNTADLSGNNASGSFEVHVVQNQGRGRGK
ncbi:MAG: PKD domain-containing protein [Cyclonatronaceae bacterium]